MSVAKVIEITASSPKGFDAAVQEGIRRAAGTVEKIKAAWVNEMSVVVDGDKVTEYRVNMKVTFVLSG